MSITPKRAAPALPGSHVATAHDKSPPDFKRRRFLAALGAGGAGVAAVATQSLATPAIATAAKVDTDHAQGYRETEHVRDYYATTRI